MTTCKLCGKEISHRENHRLGEFCCEDHFWQYQDFVGVSEEKTEVKPIKISAVDTWKFQAIKNALGKRTKFYIPNTTLIPYLSLLSFDLFLKNNGLMVEFKRGDYSVIKKSVL